MCGEYIIHPRRLTRSGRSGRSRAGWPGRCLLGRCRSGWSGRSSAGRTGQTGQACAGGAGQTGRVGACQAGREGGAGRAGRGGPVISLSLLHFPVFPCKQHLPCTSLLFLLFK